MNKWCLWWVKVFFGSIRGGRKRNGGITTTIFLRVRHYSSSSSSSSDLLPTNLDPPSLWSCSYSSSKSCTSPTTTTMYLLVKSVRQIATWCQRCYISQVEEEKAGTSSWLKKRKKNKRMRTFRSSPNIEEREWREGVVRGWQYCTMLFTEFFH